MASIQRSRGGWRVQVVVDGKRLSRCFKRKSEAKAWAMAQEMKQEDQILPDYTWAQALLKFEETVSCHRSGAQWERLRFQRFAQAAFAGLRLGDLKPEDFAQWRDARLQHVKPGTVAREMGLMRVILETARRDWHWLHVNPMNDVRKPKTPPGRARRILPHEEAALVAAFGLNTGLKAHSKTQRVGLAFLLALETGLRAGEMLALTWPHSHLKQRYIHLPRSKNGDARDVPLTRRAVEILQTLPKTPGPVFQLTAAQRDSLWRKIRDKTGLLDLHFHDSRAEAIWRLSKKLQVLDLARITGHRDPKSLMIYYNTSAAELARLLD